MAQSYRDLIAWKKGMALARLVHSLTADSQERNLRPYCANAEGRRLYSSNIAEGHGRFSRREFKHFLRNARGSLAELETQAILSKDLGYLKDEAPTGLLKSADELGRILTGLISSVKDD